MAFISSVFALLFLLCSAALLAGLIAPKRVLAQAVPDESKRTRKRVLLLAGVPALVCIFLAGVFAPTENQLAAKASKTAVDAPMPASTDQEGRAPTSAVVQQKATTSVATTVEEIKSTDQSKGAPPLSPPESEKTTALTAQLQIVSARCVFDAGWTELVGEVRNVSAMPLETVWVNGVFRNSNGEVLETGTGRLSVDPLNPGQTATFKVLAAARTAGITACDATFAPIGGSTLVVSGLTGPVVVEARKKAASGPTTKSKEAGRTAIPDKARIETTKIYRAMVCENIKRKDEKCGPEQKSFPYVQCVMPFTKANVRLAAKFKRDWGEPPAPNCPGVQKAPTESPVEPEI